METYRQYIKYIQRGSDYRKFQVNISLRKKIEHLEVYHQSPENYKLHEKSIISGKNVKISIST